MNDKLSLQNQQLSIPVEHADKLLSEADGASALLYLYLLRSGGDGTAKNAASALGMKPAELEKCTAKLRALGLISGGKKLPGAENELPEYTSEYIVTRAKADKGFKVALSETESLLGHTLSAADMRTLFGIYDHLGLPPEVIMLLLNHCVEEYREKYGPGRVPTMRSIEKEAYVWANRELLTLEAADEYLAERARRRDLTARLRTSLGIRDRELSQTERRYIESWLDMGFPLEAIELAYDRTVTNIGQLRWSYMDKIIKSWQQKELFTVSDIESGDARPARAGASKTVPTIKTSMGDADELDRIKRIYDRVKNGQG